MKTNLLFTALLLLFFGLSLKSTAQVVDTVANDTIVVIMDEGEEKETQDTTEIKVGRNIRIIIGDDSKINLGDDDDDDEEDNNKRSRVGVMAFDLGITNYLTNGSIGLDGAPDPRMELRSFRPGAHVALHFLPTEAYLIGKSVSVKTALTIDWNNYYFNDDITLQPRADQLTIIDPDPEAAPLARNKLTTRYFQLPLLLHFNTDPKDDKGFSLSVGGYAGVLWGAHTKQRDENRELTKIRDDFNLNPWRYGLMARVDLRWLDVYVQYNLSDMFAENQGPVARTFNVGLNILDF